MSLILVELPSLKWKRFNSIPVCQHRNYSVRKHAVVERKSIFVILWSCVKDWNLSFS